MILEANSVTSYKERLFSAISKWIYGRLFARDITVNASHGKCKLKNIVIYLCVQILLPEGV